MIKKLGLIVGILIAALILFAAGIMIGEYGLNQTPEATTQAPAPQSAKPTLTTSIPTPPPLTTNTPTPSQTLSGVHSNSDKVDFTLQIIDVKEPSKLRRLITGDIGNSGNVDAHNVICKIEAYSNGNPLKINGQDFINQTLGTIQAGQRVNTIVDMEFDWRDSLTLTLNGVTVKLQISSDEKTQLLSYDYKP